MEERVNNGWPSVYHERNENYRRYGTGAGARSTLSSALLEKAVIVSSNANFAVKATFRKPGSHL